METWCVNLHLLDYYLGDEVAGAGSMMACYRVYKRTRVTYAFVCFSVLFDTPLHAGISFLQMISAALMPGLRQWAALTATLPEASNPNTKPRYRCHQKPGCCFLKPPHENANAISIDRRAAWLTEQMRCALGSKIPSRLCVHTCFGLSPRSAFRWLYEFEPYI